MIAKLTKDQVAKLSPEQQQVVARLAIDEGRRQRLLMSRARGYRGYKILHLLVLFGGIVFWESMRNSEVLMPVLACAAYGLICYHAAGINSRIDAVLDLIDQQNAKAPINKAQQNAADQPTTAPESKPEGKGNSKPESEEYAH